MRFETGLILAMSIIGLGGIALVGFMIWMQRHTGKRSGRHLRRF